MSIVKSPTLVKPEIQVSPGEKLQLQVECTGWHFDAYFEVVLLTPEGEIRTKKILYDKTGLFRNDTKGKYSANGISIPNDYEFLYKMPYEPGEYKICVGLHSVHTLLPKVTHTDKKWSNTYTVTVQKTYFYV